MSVEERLYACFKRVFDEENGNRSVKLNESTAVSDEAGYEVSREFFEEMYQRWLAEGNVDKGDSKCTSRTSSSSHS